MNRNQHQHPARNRRGAALVLIAVMLPVLLGFAVLSVDVGYLVNVRIELQNVADAAALAGASGLPVGPDTVVERAKEYAAKHLGLAVPMLQNGDIQLGKWDSDTATFIPVSNPDEERADAVRVTALMSAERGNAVFLRRDFRQVKDPRSGCRHGDLWHR